VGVNIYGLGFEFMDIDGLRQMDQWRIFEGLAEEFSALVPKTIYRHHRHDEDNYIGILSVKRT